MPHNPLEVENYLLAVGALNPYADLYLNDEEDDPEQVQVKLIADTAIDNHLQLLFPQDAKLSTVNTVCDLFYHLPFEQQINLTHNMADGKINGEKELLNAIKGIKASESPHDLPAIVFSRVKLWTDTGEECEFYMGGVPKDNDDFDENDDFEDFLNQISTTDTKEITAYITTFSEGDGECVPATQADIERVYNAIADVDIETITGWNKIGESQFSFDYDIDELFNLKGTEYGKSDKERQKKEFSALVEKLMDEVNCGSDRPIIIWRENNGWASEFTAHADGEDRAAAIREKDPSAIIVTGADFAKGSYAYVYDKILALRFRAEYDATPTDAANRAELAEIVDFLEDSMGSLSSKAADHLASLNNPLTEIHARISSNISDKEFDEVIERIENMRDADEQPGITGIE
ncbi:MAG: hypothetical protein LBS36_10875 [Oscillospiraceae bacterium]|nr:hypothetical protein [Oscillospiraceae bacterium]